MASSKDYLEYVLDLLTDVNDITFKKMMGEYLLYKDDILFGGVYDNRFLVKKTSSLSSYDLLEEIPYKGAKPMYLIDSENRELIKEIVERAVSDLS